MTDLGLSNEAMKVLNEALLPGANEAVIDEARVLLGFQQWPIALPELCIVCTEGGYFDFWPQPMRLTWYYGGDRKTPPAPYAQVIRGYGVRPVQDKEAEAFINSLMTRQEAEALVQWLERIGSPGEHSYHQVALPVSRAFGPVSYLDTMPHERIKADAPFEAIVYPDPHDVDEIVDYLRPMYALLQRAADIGLKPGVTDSELKALSVELCKSYETGELDFTDNPVKRWFHVEIVDEKVSRLFAPPQDEMDEPFDIPF